MKKAVFFAAILIGGIIFVTPVHAAKHIKACSNSVSGHFHCHAHIVTDDSFTPLFTSFPDGYGPQQFLKAYGLKGKVTKPISIAIVDAYDAPTVYSDLQTYSKTFGIPGIKGCPINQGTVSAPCFQKINQTGGIKYPKVDTGWAQETALDIEVVHAVCQNCNILLVEANSDSFSDLLSAFDKAKSFGVKVISNSYGGSEFSSETSFDAHFNQKGIAVTFSSGDSGYGAEYPAASQYVTAVGGTSLQLSAKGTYQSEVAWNGAGSGCSHYENKPSSKKIHSARNERLLMFQQMQILKQELPFILQPLFKGKKVGLKLAEHHLLLRLLPQRMG